jgi:hypothetical protein
MDFQRNAPPAELPIEDPGNPHSLANGMREYINVMDRMRTGPVAPGQAPIPGDQQERANHLKAACYYLDVSMAGVCRIPEGAFLEEPVTNHSLSEAAEREYGTGSADNPMAEISVREGRAAWEQSQAALQKPLGHTHALAIVVEYPRDPRPGEPGASWLHGTQAQRAALRAAEVGAVMANYLRMLGFDARLHTRTASELDIDHVLVEAGLAEPTGAVAECPAQVPFLGERFGAVIVSTDLELAADKYLAEGACRRARDFEWWVGLGGTRPGYKGPLYKGRDFHMGLYPMEAVKRVAEPTTLIDAARVPRVPKRHDMFIRASIGDLGDKAKKELTDFRMITKSPFGHAMIPVLGGMVPLQYGEELSQQAAGYEDPHANSQMIKAAMYYLGADMVGIRGRLDQRCPEYARLSASAVDRGNRGFAFARAGLFCPRSQCDGPGCAAYSTQPAGGAGRVAADRGDGTQSICGAAVQVGHIDYQYALGARHAYRLRYAGFL